MITVLVSELYKAASTARKVAKPIKTLPVTNTLRVKIHDHHMLITPFVFGTQHERALLTEAIQARVEGEEWETCIPSKPFIDWLRASLPTKEEKKGGDQYHKYEVEQLNFTFDPSTQTVTIKAGNTRAQFKCIDAQEFPA